MSDSAQSAQASAATPQRRNSQEQQALEHAFRDLFEERICFNRALGLKLQAFNPNGPTFRFAMRPDLVGHYLYDRLHGGVISAVLDATGGAAIMWAIAEKHPLETSEQIMHRFARLGTVDLRIDYLRPGLGSHFSASALVTRLGGRIASTQMRLESDSGKLIATGSAAYIVS